MLVPADTYILLLGICRCCPTHWSNWWSCRDKLWWMPPWFQFQIL